MIPPIFLLSLNNYQNEGNNVFRNVHNLYKPRLHRLLIRMHCECNQSGLESGLLNLHSTDGLESRLD